MVTSGSTPPTSANTWGPEGPSSPTRPLSGSAATTQTTAARVATTTGGTSPARTAAGMSARRPWASKRSTKRPSPVSEPSVTTASASRKNDVAVKK